MGWTRQKLDDIINFMVILVQCITRLIFRNVIYRGSKQELPRIKTPIITESVMYISKMIKLKQVTCEELLDAYIQRIKDVNPILNCIVATRFDEAREEAQRYDKLLASEYNTIDWDERPLLGIPFTTKDCIAVKGMIQTGGLVRRRHVVAEEDADVIACLRAAGAIPIALTNVSELCMWWESHNHVHGRTNNAYDTRRIVGGSSGGEGCGQSVCCSAFGIGSDIGGSIRMPCFFNGVFGHKPSPHTVSNRGQFPATITEAQNSFLGIGPICRYSSDLPLLLSIMQKSLHPSIKSLSSLQNFDNVKDIRFFYQECDGGGRFVSPVHRDILTLFRQIGNYLSDTYNGKTMTKVHFTEFRETAPMWLANMKAPAGSPTFSQQLLNLEGPGITPVLELAKWCIGFSDHTLIGIFTAAVDGMGVRYGDAKHEMFVQKKEALRNKVMELLGDDGVLLYPTHPTPALFHNEPLFRALNFSYTSVFNMLALPSTHIPLGFDSKDGLPIGLQVVAKDKCDALCLSVAIELEKAFGGWKLPV